jgi:hypothetical protein
MGFGGGRPSEKVTHAGLPAIWARAEIRREQDTALLEDIAGRLAYFKTLLPQVREFYLWLVQRPDLSPDVRVGAASSLARYFDMPEQADQLLERHKAGLRRLRHQRRARLGGRRAPRKGL